MGGYEHLMLAGYFVSSVVTLLIPFGVWLLYLIKIMAFNRQVVIAAENQFLDNIVLTPRLLKFITFTFTVLNQLTPALLYGMFLMITAYRFNKPLSIVYILGMFLVLTAGGVIILNYLFIFKYHEKSSWAFKRFLDKRWTKPYILQCIEWLIRKQLLGIFGAKVASYCILFSASYLYKTDTYDWRLIAFASVFAFSFNYTVVDTLFKFENNFLQWMRNLPFSRARRFTTSTFILLLFLIPEIVVIIRYFPHNLDAFYIIQLILFGYSIQSLFYACLFAPMARSENFTRVLFAISIVWIILILSGTSLFILTGGNVLLSVLIYSRYFYTYVLVR